MSAFTGPLAVEYSSTKSRWARLIEPLIWEMDELGSGEHVVVPAGFECDGVTVPRPFWWLMPPWGHPATRAAVLHDYLLSKDPINRGRADKQFYLALRAVGVSRILSFILWISVRLFGIAKMLLRHHRFAV